MNTFDFNQHNVRVIEIEGQPWFVAVDVCRVLGISNAKNATRNLREDELTLSDKAIGRGPKPILVSESGLYKLIMRSDKPVAREFQDWVTRHVLPAIRKDGAYVAGEEKVATGEMSEDELIGKAMDIMKRKIERLSKENAEMSDELNRVTIDEWRALSHLYLTHSDKVRIGQQASAMLRATGDKPERQTRRLTTGREVFVNVYPREVLDRAAANVTAIAA